ncbi:unnamed protein product [Spirodela intermedia]|uniref:Uncharacterized protein n=1 Tax=Spirodela intermedia TaxID=51605 RepID=A0A7I8IRD1_SPIIN|nr:unnamed protein product [Spirodela intermedia]CAA6660541.1 unnamed protein product [Spirodela intermedia]
MAFPRRLELLVVVQFLYFRPSWARTVVVDELARWERPVLHVGDSVVFRAVELSDVYMFHSRRAYKFCILSQASLLHSTAGGAPSTSHFRNSLLCDSGTRPGRGTTTRARQRDTRLLRHARANPPDGTATLAGAVTHRRRRRRGLPPVPAPRPPFHPFQPSPGASAPPPATAPSASTAGSDGGIAFISSNPAIPLPTGALDSTAARPPPDAGGGQPAAGRALGIQMALSVALAASFAFWSI